MVRPRLLPSLLTIIGLCGLTVANPRSQTSARQTIDPTCYNPPYDSCSFYTTCVEPRYHCGPTGYPIADGQTFCTKFSIRRNELDQKGITWMLDVMQCLQRVLIPEATGAPDAVQTCDELKTKALASHPKCYVDNGLCTLGPRDWLAIVDIIGLPTLLLDKDNLLTELETGEDCGEAYAFFLAHLV